MFSYIFRNIRPCSPVKYTDVSVERVASIFRAEGKVKQEIGKKKSRVLLLDPEDVGDMFTETNDGIHQTT
jgi:hypothetical protein